MLLFLFPYLFKKLKFFHISSLLKIKSNNLLINVTN